MRAGRSITRNERGQSTVLFVMLLSVTALFVAVVGAVGTLVNRRIALQAVADTGAFTGATVMAAFLFYAG